MGLAPAFSCVVALAVVFVMLRKSQSTPSKKKGLGSMKSSMLRSGKVVSEEFNGEQQARVKQEIGLWQICEDSLGEFYVHVGPPYPPRTFDEMPEELMQLLRQ